MVYFKKPCFIFKMTLATMSYRHKLMPNQNCKLSWHWVS
ncbi:hypothetical protein AO372_1771 [Moraxella catarrhalis]|nr:hypothetical protein AO372_1771 [Moraxella catarrhalis]OAV24158.1 hypothetical protein AO369_1777 [Moraxella catarrhalis]